MLEWWAILLIVLEALWVLCYIITCICMCIGNTTALGFVDALARGMTKSDTESSSNEV